MAKLQVGSMRVGFPAGLSAGGESEMAFYKAAGWTPVSIDIQVGPPGLKGTEGRIEVVIETVDSDDVATRYTVTESLPEIGPGGTFTVAGYTKPASSNSKVSITLKHDGQPLGPSVEWPISGGLDTTEALYLTVGSRMPGLRQAMNRGGDNEPPPNIPNPAAAPVNFANEHPAFVDHVDHLPDQWFGYDSVDVVILSTSKRNDFLVDFASRIPRQARRREALADWVQRGGHLIVSAGKNQDLLTQMPEIDDLLPMRLTKSESVRELYLPLDNGQGGLVAGGKRPAIEVAHMAPKPGRSYQVLLRRSRDAIDDERGEPLIVQGPYGLGRVTLVGFDLDQKPFADWEKQPQAWQWLLSQSWNREKPRGNENMPIRYGENLELLGQIQDHLENFEEVPVISFFWVALFILIYILVVGPLDYFFLKKVVKRLELTWITFPAVVLLVSGLAYYTAYKLKGSDLRIRKVDVVDIDLVSRQTVGHTWFTLFSPRIQHYTIGVEPAAPDWAPPVVEGTAPSVLVSWMSRPEVNRFGRSRGSRGQSLFRRSYDYEPAAAGLRGVPIQVWSTKSFEATWQAPLRTMQPLVAATLRHPPAAGDAARASGVSGEITWRPGATESDAGELRDAHLIYKGRLHPVALVPGVPTRVNLDVPGETVASWLRSIAAWSTQNNFPRGNRYVQTNAPNDIENLVKATLFHEAMDRNGNGYLRNDGLRLMDQTWRARPENGDEVILFARLAAQQGRAQEVSQHIASASRLWLGALPAPGAERPVLEGAMRQETFVRVFIPVLPAPKKN